MHCLSTTPAIGQKRTLGRCSLCEKHKRSVGKYRHDWSADKKVSNQTVPGHRF